MPRMQTFKTRGFTVLGPCPGCENWTLEYRNDVHMEWAAFRTDGVDLRPDLGPWHEVVEDMLQEHMAECRGLREIMFDTV